MKKNDRLLKGRLPLQVLSLLRSGDQYGSKLLRPLLEHESRSFQKQEGRLYVILHELERRGLAASYRGEEVGKIARRYYSLTRKGKRLLERSRGQWKDWPDGGAASDTDTPPETPALVDEPEEGYDPRFDPDSPDFDPRFDPDSPDFDPDEAEQEQLEKNRRTIDSWTEQVLRKLHFGPDRQILEAELKEHCYDRAEDLKAACRSKTKAMEQAVALLGEPEQIGFLLRQVRKPWQGWALRLARWAVVLLAIGLTVALIKDDYGTYGENLRFRSMARAEDLFSNFSGEEYQLFQIAGRDGSCEDEADFGPFHITFQKLICKNSAYIHRSDEETYHGTVRECGLLLRFQAAPWHTLSYDCNGMQAVLLNEKGEQYPYKIDGSRARIRPDIYAVFLPIDDWFLENAQSLELRLGREDGEFQSMRIQLGPWYRSPEQLPELEDEEAAIQQMNPFGDPLWYPGVEVRPTRLWTRSVSAEAVKSENLEISIPKALETAYGVGQQLVERWNHSTGVQHEPVSGCVVECLLELRGDITLVPLRAYELEQCLRVTDARTGVEMQSLDVDWYLNDAEQWYRDACFWRVSWAGDLETDCYTLQYTPPDGGEPLILTLTLGEEETP